MGLSRDTIGERAEHYIRKLMNDVSDMTQVTDEIRESIIRKCMADSRETASPSTAQLLFAVANYLEGAV